MPKMKTHSGTAKRVKVTGTGKVRRQQSGMSHLMPNKTSKQKRHLRKGNEVSKSDLKRIKQQISNLL
ncbi:50S ribosomal protein L35 [Mycoplasmatota bacterium WC44]